MIRLWHPGCSVWHVTDSGKWEKFFFLNLICGRVILSVTRYLQDLHRHTTKRNETGAYDHMGCAVLILIDIIHIVSDLWEVIWSLFLFTLEVSQSEQRGRGEGDVGHRGIFSYGFRSPLQWVIMQCWSVAGGGHMRRLQHSLTASREPSEEGFFSGGVGDCE